MSVCLSVCGPFLVLPTGIVVQKEQILEKIFMKEASVKECTLSLKIKNSAGYDCSPQRVLIEGVDYLLN